MKPSKFRLFIGIIVVVCFLSGLGILAGVLSVRQTYYEFTAKFPDAKTMNISTDIPFDDVSTHSLGISDCLYN